METTSLFMWMAGSGAVVAAGIAVGRLWKLYTEAESEVSTLRFQLERAHKVVDAHAEQVKSMNGSIRELRAELQDLRRSEVKVSPKKAQQVDRSLWTMKRKSKSSKRGAGYAMSFVSNSVADWLKHVPKPVVRSAYERMSYEDEYIQKSSFVEGQKKARIARFGFSREGVLYRTRYFDSVEQAREFRRLLFIAYGLMSGDEA